MIGFIGLGNMGAAMAVNLLQAGYKVSIFARNRQRVQSVLDAGAIWSDNPAELAASCDYVFTIVGGPADVKALYLGRDGLLENARPDTVLVDMTTSSPALARTISQACADRSLHFLDAPVTGGVAGAKAGTVTFMVGGAAPTLKRVTPYLETMGATIFHMGGAGSGQIAKSCNQIAVSGILLGATEALNHAHKQGISTDKVFQVLSTGTAGGPLLKSMGERLQASENATSFTLSHFIKDLEIALKDAAHTGQTLSSAAACLKYCQEIEKSNGGDSGLQVLLEYYKNKR